MTLNPSAAITVDKATRKEWLGLIAIALPCMLYSMDLTVLNLAVPALARDLKPSASQLLWIIDVYGFMVAGFLVVMGALGDRFGRRKVLLIGAAAFGATSIFAAFAQTAEQLIAARAALGIAGATLAPSTLSLISNMFRDEHERTFAISMWIASFSAGAILGPLVGGVLLHYFWWGSVFLAAVPIMLLLFIAGPLLLPEFKNPDAARIDVLSALMSLAAVLAFIYGVKHVAEAGLDLRAVVAMALGIAIGWAFFRRQSLIAHPMIDLGLFRSRAFSVSLTVNILALFFMFGAFVFFAQYLQLVAGLDALTAGLWSLPAAICFTIVSFLNARLAAAIPGRELLAYGMLVSAAGFTALFFADEVLPQVICYILVSCGFTPVIALTTGYIVGSAPPEKAGVASAISETSAELGGALGIALLGSLATYIYRGRMTGVSTAGLPPDAANTLRTSLATALETTAALPADIAGPIQLVARSAFMDAYHLAALLAALVLTALAILALKVLPKQPPQAAH
jgi:MFS transporter, DHA2 family, multidrug resistance protein